MSLLFAGSLLCCSYFVAPEVITQQNISARFEKSIFYDFCFFSRETTRLRSSTSRTSATTGRCWPAKPKIRICKIPPFRTRSRSKFIVSHPLWKSDLRPVLSTFLEVKVLQFVDWADLLYPSSAQKSSAFDCFDSISVTKVPQLLPKCCDVNIAVFRFQCDQFYKLKKQRD